MSLLQLTTVAVVRAVIPMALFLMVALLAMAMAKRAKHMQ